ncbi:helix-turn-helix transcriptional regulator, partial [Isoptericola hypogeus]
IVPIHLDALLSTGQRTRTDDLMEQVAIWRSGCSAPVWSATWAWCKGLRHEASGATLEAAIAFEESASVFASLPRPYEQLLASERHGLCLIGGGERAAGIDVLRAVLVGMDDLGASGDAQRVAALVRHHGAGPDRRWRGGSRGYGDQLSPREQEVIALVATGMTNKEVAQVLFLSPKTVGLHLSRVMHKLGVSTRTAAAIAASEAGLIPQG